MKGGSVSGIGERNENGKSTQNRHIAERNTAEVTGRASFGEHEQGKAEDVGGIEVPSAAAGLQAVVVGEKDSLRGVAQRDWFKEGEKCFQTFKGILWRVTA